MGSRPGWMRMDARNYRALNLTCRRAPGGTKLPAPMSFGPSTMAPWAPRPPRATAGAEQSHRTHHFRGTLQPSPSEFEQISNCACFGHPRPRDKTCPTEATGPWHVPSQPNARPLSEGYLQNFPQNLGRWVATVRFQFDSQERLLYSKEYTGHNLLARLIHLKESFDGFRRDCSTSVENGPIVGLTYYGSTQTSAVLYPYALDKPTNNNTT
jgi:hypothetical protein